MLSDMNLDLMVGAQESVERDDKTQLLFTGKNVNEMMKLRPLICYCDIFSEKKKNNTYPPTKMSFGESKTNALLWHGVL